MSVYTLHIRTAVMVVLAVVFAALFVWWQGRSVEAQQGPLIVNYLLDDRGICDTDCGLREAILSAAPGTIIQVPADRFLLTLDTEIVIDKPLTIRGAGADQTFIESSNTLASSTVRIFRVTSENVVISDLTIRHGSVSGDGGAILNEGGLTIENSILTNNHASINGGAVANKGTLHLMNTTIIDNDASLNGGGVFSGSNANLLVEQSFILNNTAVNGGGIYNELRGKVEIIDSGIRDNIANSGGGVHSQGSSVVSVDNTTFLGNTATTTGGGIFSLGNFSIDRSSLRENEAIHGGALYVGAGEFALAHVQVLDNKAELGGGAFVAGDGRLSATQSSFENNEASSSGGGVFVRGGLLDLTASTITGNRTLDSGGGIKNGGTLALTNTTMTENISTGGSGGAVFNDGKMTATNATLVRNDAEVGRGGGVFNLEDPRDFTRGEVELANTLIAANRAAEGPDCFGAPHSLGHNLIGNADHCTWEPVEGDLLGTAEALIDPRLLALGRHGGPTETIGFLTDSPAIDAGGDDLAPAMDQRGGFRPIGIASDIGAYESGQNPPVSVDDIAVTDEDKAVTINVIANDTDVEADELKVANLVQPSRGRAVAQSNGRVIVYTPSKDFTGTDAFAYTASDGVLEGNMATVEITVNPVNDAPVAAVDFLETFPGIAIIISPLKNDKDVDGDPISIVEITQPTNGEAVLNDDETITYAPNEGFLGVDRFTYTITDSQIESAETIISITVVEAPAVATTTPVATPTTTPATIPGPGSEPTATPEPDGTPSAGDVSTPTPTATVDPEVRPTESAGSPTPVPPPHTPDTQSPSQPTPTTVPVQPGEATPTPTPTPSEGTSPAGPTPTPGGILVPTVTPTVAPFFYPTALPTKTPFAFATVASNSTPVSTDGASASARAATPTVTPNAAEPNNNASSGEDSATSTDDQPSESATSTDEGGIAFGFCSAPLPGQARRVDLSLVAILIGAIAVSQKRRFPRLR